MQHEAQLRATTTGEVPDGSGWFVVNACDARWHHAPGRSAVCSFEGEDPFPQLGVNLSILQPGQSMAMYHWEIGQEDFFVLSGEALLVIEGQQRRLRSWDFVHCPPGTEHVIVGTGESPCVILAVGARVAADGDEWGAYTVEPLAQRLGAGIGTTTAMPSTAYAGLARRRPTAYDDRWLEDPS